jgi:uncharacterized repeat protein (TIGR01451 family)
MATRHISSTVHSFRRRHRLRPGVEQVESRQLLATFLVTTVADSGSGSLRQAILDADATTTQSTINFNIAPGGAQTIIPSSPLPVISNPMIIDGTTQPGSNGTPIIQINGSQIFVPGSNPPAQMANVAGLYVTSGNTTVKGLVINRFTGDGILLSHNGSNHIVDNYIGTDLTGTFSLSNGQSGVYLIDSRNNIIGGSTAADRNLISGNAASGVWITATSPGTASGNAVIGNDIGVDATGAGNLGNAFDGVTITSGNNKVGGKLQGEGNTIAFNGADGVRVENFFYGQPISTYIVSNSIHDNAGMSIDFGYNVFNPVNSAMLTSAYESGANTVVEGTFYGAANTPFTVQFFSSPASERSGTGPGQTLIDTQSVATDYTGVARFTVTLPTAVAVNQTLSATATDPSNSTSTFFHNTQVTQSALADLSVSQYAFPQPAIAGNPLVFVLTAYNRGPSNATSVVLTDTLPTGMTVKSVTAPDGTVTQSGSVVRVAYDNLHSGQSASVQITVIPTLTGSFTNKAVLAASQTDPKPDDNTSTLDVQVAPNPNPPQVTSVNLIVGLRSIDGIILKFNEPLDPAQAVNPINYRLLKQALNQKFTVPVAFNTPVYDPSALTITITPKQPLKLGKVYRLELNGTGSAGITDPAGNLLVGNSFGAPAGPYVVSISRGVTPTPPRPTHTPRPTGGQTRLVEIVNGRRVLTGPSGSANLPSLAENTGFSNSLNTNG